MTKILVIVDMQNDFVTGSLGSEDAQAIVPNIVDLIANGGYDGIYVTLDTHKDDYLETAEGKKLPVPHCIEYTNGWLIQPDIRNALMTVEYVRYIQKPTFGSTELCSNVLGWRKTEDIIDFVGVCTDICVVSNVLMTKAYTPWTRIRVIANACAGTSPEAHQAALKVMQSCQIEIVTME